MPDTIVVHALALLVGSTLAALVYEATAGNERFSLPFANIPLVTVVGTVLSIWWGWTSTLATLGVYAAFSVVGGLLDRHSAAIDAVLPAPPHVAVDETSSDEAPAHGPDDITDIVFRTERSLEEIAAGLGLKDPSFDAENYWEWVIGGFGGARVDITRTHRRPPGDVVTRLFLVDGGSIGPRLKSRLVEGLRPLATGTISCGRSVYLTGNDYEFETVEEHEGDA